jgi:hypothetical protein
MAIKTQNHAGKRDFEKTLNTETKQYDNGEGGVLSIDNLIKFKNRGASLDENKPDGNNIPISKECADFMNKCALKKFNNDGQLDLNDMVINHLAPAFINGGVS